jgi:uracil-DNA glycosylase
MWQDYWAGRGRPWEHDPGPEPGGRFGELFAETPDYRSIGLRYAGQEVFRWHFGPMFYRGRIEGGDARVLVIGQEGAQDESLSHRSFTGGTGGRMQHVLRHLGITRSYLFLNTFIYPIFGQYGDHLRPLGQDLRSPIVAHRHAILDHTADVHPLRLVVAVGTAAKETVTTWIRAHGGSARPDRLHEAEAAAVRPGLRAIGVLHPGAASGGATEGVAADFRRALGMIDEWRRRDRDWLPDDDDGDPQPAARYRYRVAPVPFRDLPLGVPWRLGWGSTASNRRDGQTAIQMFSAAGRYNNSGQAPAYREPGPGRPGPGRLPEGDRAWEPPRADWQRHDRGPAQALARLIMGGTDGLAWPDAAALGAPPSFGHGPVYRGRPVRAAVLVLVDPADPDDLFHGRAWCGEAGQHLQGWLGAAGVGSSYAIVRVIPVDPVGAADGAVAAWVTSGGTRRLLSRIVAEVGPQAVVAIGRHAGSVVHDVTPDGVPTVLLTGHGAHGWREAWREGLARLADLPIRRADAARPWDGAARPIPREDLPYGTLWWQATSGTRGQRPTIDGRMSPDYVKLVMPRWAAELRPNPLPAGVASAVDALRP